jgi:thiamine-phosphate pyrophosphorylase
LNVNKKDLLLYVVTDRTWLGEQTLENQVEEAIRAGATFIQLREKNVPFELFVERAKRMKEVTDYFRIPFVINDNIDVAIAVDADGVHIGQGDIDALLARKQIGDDKILGVSAQTVTQAISAQEAGADYIGVGAVFATHTKNDAESVSIDTLKAICRAVQIPVVAIGGIDKDTIKLLEKSGIAGVAVISAIFAKSHIASATSEILALAKEVI